MRVKANQWFLLLVSMVLMSYSKLVYSQKDFVYDDLNQDVTSKFIVDSFHLKKGNTSLILIAERESKTAKHFSFVQSFEGKMIAGTFVKIAIGKQNEIVQLNHNLSNFEDLMIDKQPISLSPILDYYQNNNLKVLAIDSVWWIKDDQAQNAIRFYIQDKNFVRYNEIRTSKGLVDVEDQTFFFMPDSLVTGRVFNPDPLTTAGVVYGGLYRDFGDADTPALNNQRVNVSFKADFVNDTFHLRNQYIELRDLDGNGVIQVKSITPTFDFTRFQSGFEDVNVFYHLSTYQKYISDLGFSVADALVLVDPHGTLADNSFFTTPNFLYFGTGGVDDAEDADVILHEYTHFLSSNASPNSNSGTQRRAIDEALGDYFAASYSKSLNTFNFNNVYSWDGHNEFWNGRVVNSAKLFPLNITNNIYRDAEIFSASLMQVNDEIGLTTTDNLSFEFLYYLVQNMTFPQAAELYLRIDTLLYNGANFCALYKHFFNRGFLPLRANNCGVTAISQEKNIPAKLIFNELGFTVDAIDVKVSSFKIFDLQGREVVNNEGTTFSGRKRLTEGVYIVKIFTDNGIATVKWFNAY